ncbi:MAG: hypothetical protein PHW13_08195 [Methylococcales bacterium]|nr:hypothetical protein [Methylococcales bacterium]
MADFIKNAEEVARLAMSGIDKNLTNQYTSLIRFLVSEPNAASKNSASFGSAEYIKDKARS